jgi:hypothetical protein
MWWQCQNISIYASEKEQGICDQSHGAQSLYAKITSGEHTAILITIGIYVNQGQGEF